MAVPPDFTAGQILTAAQMNAVGSWLIKKQTIGTAVSSVEVTGAFSADYENYRIVVSGGVASTALGLNLTLGATVTGYYYAWVGYTYAGATNNSNSGGAATAFTSVGAGSTTTLQLDVTLCNPFTAKNSVVYGQYLLADTASGLTRTYGGHLANTTSYTAFTLTTSTGNITGGTIYVYGLRD